MRQMRQILAKFLVIFLTQIPPETASLLSSQHLTQPYPGKDTTLTQCVNAF